MTSNLPLPSIYAKSPFQGKIKIFLDGADRAHMVELASNPHVAGFTTNPSLMKKAGVKDYRAFCQEILGQVKGKPISFEVFADDFAGMKKQAMEIKSWEDASIKKGVPAQVYVKIPILNTKGELSIPLIRELSHQGVKINITALYTLDHIWQTCEAVKGGAPAIVSVFAGRIADSGRDPLPLMQAASAMCAAAAEAGKSTIELLWASTREAFNVVQAELIGCPIITAPADVIKKMEGFNRTLDQLTLDTVKTFFADSTAAGFSL